MKSICLTTLLGGVLLVGAMMAGGCANNNQITVQSIRDDMTPELQATAMTPEQRQTRIARATDHSLRQIWDDLDYIFLIDQPTHLTHYPIP